MFIFCNLFLDLQHKNYSNQGLSILSLTLTSNSIFIYHVKKISATISRQQEKKITIYALNMLTQAGNRALEADSRNCNTTYQVKFSRCTTGLDFILPQHLMKSSQVTSVKMVSDNTNTRTRFT
jgi:hypothetical protein